MTDNPKTSASREPKAKIILALMEGRPDEVVQSLKEDSVELFRKLDCIDLLLPEKEAQVPPQGL